MTDGSQEDCDRFVLVLVDGDSMPVRLIWVQIFPTRNGPRMTLMSDISSSLILSCQEAWKVVRMLASIFAQLYWIIINKIPVTTPMIESSFVSMPTVKAWVRLTKQQKSFQTRASLIVSWLDSTTATHSLITLMQAIAKRQQIQK